MEGTCGCRGKKLGSDDSESKNVPWAGQPRESSVTLVASCGHQLGSSCDELISVFFLQLDIKDHVFFSPINWDDLYHKRLTPPFNPNVVSEHGSSEGRGEGVSRFWLLDFQGW